MLCAGAVPGDLSELNVLRGANGPVIIDLPQAVDAAGNDQAKCMLLGDVANPGGFVGCFAPELPHTDHGHEIGDLYQRGAVHPAVTLAGRFERRTAAVKLTGVMREIDEARAGEAARRLRPQAVPKSVLAIIISM